MFYFEVKDQLNLLANWFMGYQTEDIAIIDKSLFSEFKELYKSIAAGNNYQTIHRISDKSKEQIADELRSFGYEEASTINLVSTIIGYKNECDPYTSARFKALDSTKSLLIDKLREAKDNDRQALYYQIDEISDIIAGKEKTPIEKSSATAFLESFLNGETLAEMPFIETHFNNFDAALDGGLYPGLYVLGALSSMGKTSLMLQIADQIAAAGTNALYFTLEMGAHELIAKSLSRYSFIEAGKIDNDAATAKSITNMRKRALFNSYQIINVDKATEKYKNDVAANLWYFESLGDIGTKEIRHEIEKHLKATGKTPIVFIDYLQILKPYNEFWTEKRNTDKAITELRKLSRDYKTPVFCISSLNRDSYKGDIDLNAFKESGAIEYGSDVLLGLQPRGLEDGTTPKEAKANKKAIEEEKRKAERSLEIKILKNRSGATGQRIPFTYNAKFNYFSDENADVPGWEPAPTNVMF